MAARGLESKRAGIPLPQSSLYVTTMTTTSESTPAQRRKPGRGWRFWLKRGAITLAALALAPFVLTVIYTVVPPISMPMIGRLLTLQGYSRDWVSLDQIAPSLADAVLSSEDARFCLHSGVDFVELRKVLDRDGGPSRGASTVAMQVAKNLFYWPFPTLVRKVAEIPTALWIDFVWSKRRVIEVYLNIAEWDDGIYGAEAAAQWHFDKSASKLTARESALMAAALPNPIKRDAGNPSRRLRNIAGNITIRARNAGETLDCIE